MSSNKKKGKIKFGGKTYHWEYPPGSKSKTPMHKSKITLKRNYLHRTKLRSTVKYPKIMAIDFLDRYFSDDQLREVIDQGSTYNIGAEDLSNYKRSKLLKILDKDNGWEPLCTTIYYLVNLMDEEQLVNVCKDTKLKTTGSYFDLQHRFLDIFEDELSSELEKFENEGSDYKKYMSKYHRKEEN